MIKPKLVDINIIKKIKIDLFDKNKYINTFNLNLFSIFFILLICFLLYYKYYNKNIINNIN